MSITVPLTTPVGLLWNDILNPAVSYQTLWTQYPMQMMYLFPTVLDIRTKLTPSLSSNGLDLVACADIFTQIKNGVSIFTVCTQYPELMMKYGSDIASIAKCDADYSAIQLNRFKTVVSKLRNGSSLDNLIQDYTDILATGAYDLIHLDKWIKTGTFPS